MHLRQDGTMVVDDAGRREVGQRMQQLRLRFPWSWIRMDANG
jgi:hypothetical protein